MSNPEQGGTQDGGVDGEATEVAEGAQDDAPPEFISGVRIEVVEVNGRQYVFDHWLEVDDEQYAALRPVEGDGEDAVFIALFKQANGEGAKDEYLEVPPERHEAVIAAFKDHYYTVYVDDVAYRLLADAEIDGVLYYTLELKEGPGTGLFFAIDNDGEDLVLLTGEEDNYGEVVAAFREIFKAELAAAGAEEFLDHGGGMGGHEDPS